MPNMQIPLAGLSGEEMVACVIYCCDKKPYDFAAKRDATKSCQRMGSRKHSCVLHNLRKRTSSGGLTQTNRYPDQARGNPRMQTIDGHNCIPDCLAKINGKWQVIDAKFPCDPAELNPKLGVPPNAQAGGKSKVTCESTSAGGASMTTAKERDLYTEFKVDDKKVSKVSCMTPSDAESKKGKCDCTEVDGGGDSDDMDED